MNWFKSSIVSSAVIAATVFSISSTAGPFDGFVDKNMLGAATDAVKAATLTEADMIEMAKKSAVEMDKNNPVAMEQTGDAKKYGERLHRLFSPHKHEDGLNLNYKAYVVSNFNAFAMPDGSVRVFAGLMDKLTDEEILGIIGHEIGHVKLKHSLNEYKKELLTSSARKSAAAAGGKAGAIAAGELGAIGEQFITAQFSQADELAADLYGINFLKKHGYNPQAMVTAFQKMQADGGDNASLFASHPATSKRIERMEAEIK